MPLPFFTAALRGRIEVTRIDSALLRDNALGDPHERDVLVYLPPGYDDGPRLPTVMLLPGFGSNNRSLLGYDPWKPNVAQLFERLILDGSCAPALLVLPDAMTRHGGSQFLDSAATGPYQSYLADEVIPHVDATYRTIPKREARAVAGRSSGGFGALRLGMDRPDVVSVLAAHAGDGAFEQSVPPMFAGAAVVFEQAGGVAAFAAQIAERGPRGDEFDALFVMAAAAAYAPDLDAPPLHARLPFDLQTLEPVPDVWERWLAQDPVRRMDTSQDALSAMSLIYLDVGNRDEYGLQYAARQIAQRARARGATVHAEEFDGGHRGTSYRYADSLPRIVGALATE